jgi:hypothetical protein
MKRKCVYQVYVPEERPDPAVADLESNAPGQIEAAAGKYEEKIRQGRGFRYLCSREFTIIYRVRNKTV